MNVAELSTERVEEFIAFQHAQARHPSSHRAVDYGTVKVAFDRPEVRNAFRPHTVDELCTALDHARQ